MDIKELFAAPSDGSVPDYRSAIDELKKGRGIDAPDMKQANLLELKHHDINDEKKRPNKKVKVDKSNVTENVKQVTTSEGNESDESTRWEKVARIALALQQLIVKRAVAFVFGNPVYLNAETGEDENMKAVLKAVERILYDVKQKSLNRKVARVLFSCTEVAELWYPVEKKHKAYGFDSEYKLRVAVFNPMKGDILYPYFDETGDMTAFSREFTIEKETAKINYFETYTDEFHYMWNLSENGYAIVEGYPKANELGKIPVVFGNQEKVEWAEVQNLIDRLEKLLSNFADTNDYHASPKIVVKGELTGFAKKGESGAILQLEGDDASANYLAWQNAPESVKLEIETLLRMIYTITQTPDISFDAVKGLGAISGIALKLLFMDAHLKVADHSEVLDEYLQRRMNIIKAFVGKFKVDLADAAEELQIEPEIIPYMIDDELADITKWTTANGNKPIISQKLSVQLAGLSKDYEADFDQIQDENAKANQFTFNEPTEV